MYVCIYVCMYVYYEGIPATGFPSTTDMEHIPPASCWNLDWKGDVRMAPDSREPFLRMPEASICSVCVNGICGVCKHA